MLGRRLDESGAGEAVADLRVLRLDRYPAQPFLDRIWELRHDVTAYDATYVALAETLDAALLTCERRLLDLPAAASPVRVESPFGLRG